MSLQKASNLLVRLSLFKKAISQNQKLYHTLHNASLSCSALTITDTCGKYRTRQCNVAGQDIAKFSSIRLLVQCNLLPLNCCRHFTTKVCRRHSLDATNHSSSFRLKSPIPWLDGPPKRNMSLKPMATIVEAAPKNVQPYLRLVRFDKPIGKL